MIISSPIFNPLLRISHYVIRIGTNIYIDLHLYDMYIYKVHEDGRLDVLQHHIYNIWIYLNGIIPKYGYVQQPNNIVVHMEMVVDLHFNNL